MYMDYVKLNVISIDNPGKLSFSDGNNSECRNDK